MRTRNRTTATTWNDGGLATDNRRIGDLRAEVRASLSGRLEAGARRRAERRVRLLAALLDAGGSGLQA